MQVLRALKRTFGISAPRVAVRAHVPWYWRWMLLALAAAGVAGVGWMTYHFGLSFAGFRQSETERTLAQLNETIGRQQQEIAELRMQATQAERELQMERATYAQLEKQVKTLSEQNAALREDLAFFQSLMPAGGGDAALTINRFQVQKDGVPGEYRYRLLLVRTGKRDGEFQGRLQFVIHLVQDTQRVVLMLPLENDPVAKDYQLSFKFFQRVEGTFKVSPDAVVKSMQVRVFENGAKAPRLTQTINVS
jgi:hypothetical protein